MNAGLRQYKQASCRIAIPTGLPEDMQDRLREVLAVTSEAKRGGEATALLHQITTEADFAWMVLLIHVKPFDVGMTIEQLEKFYGEFGFETIQNEPLLMTRQPQRPKLVKVH